MPNPPVASPRGEQRDKELNKLSGLCLRHRLPTCVSSKIRRLQMLPVHVLPLERAHPPGACRQFALPGKTCQRTSDCNSPELECFRHQDRRNVLQGLCLHSSHLLNCFTHTDCPDDLQCVVGWCAPARYLDAIAELGCDSDGLCEDLLLGDACCYDLRGAVLPEGSWPGGYDGPCVLMSIDKEQIITLCRNNCPSGGEKRCCKEEVVAL